MVLRSAWVVKGNLELMREVVMWDLLRFPHSGNAVSQDLARLELEQGNLADRKHNFRRCELGASARNRSQSQAIAEGQDANHAN